MFENSDAFSGMSSNDIDASRAFYEGVLGLVVEDQGMGGLISVQLPKGGAVLIYPKDDHQPATFTILNFPVEDIDAVVDELASKGVNMLQYDGTGQMKRVSCAARSQDEGRTSHGSRTRLATFSLSSQADLVLSS